MRLLLDLGGLWLIVLVMILLNGRFGIIGWLATQLGRALRWQPLGKRVAIQIAEWDPRQVPVPLLWRGTITDLVTLTNPRTQREGTYALVVLDPPVSWRSHPVDRVLLIPRHRGYDIDALPLTGIGVNIYKTELNPSPTATGLMMTTGWLRLRRFGTALAE
ncbi:MAG: hypothetical protein ACYCRH_08395 [Acidiferrobacteraceae bacterium]